MNNSELAFAPKSFTSNNDLVNPTKNEANPGFEKLTDDQLQFVGGGDVVVFW